MKSRFESPDDLLERPEAAAHSRLTEVYLLNLQRQGDGPAWVRPSPRRTLYRRSDLDKWIAGWQRHEPA
jgi:hypothetical protein